MKNVLFAAAFAALMVATAPAVAGQATPVNGCVETVQVLKFDELNGKPYIVTVPATELRFDELNGKPYTAEVQYELRADDQNGKPFCQKV